MSHFNKLFSNVLRFNIEKKLHYSVAPKLKPEKHCLISCKKKQLDHYMHMQYTNLDTVPLASKGWNHNKSRGDYFTINPIENDYELAMEPWSRLELHNTLNEVLKREGIKKATGFQMRAIPKIQTGRHILLAAETGCGKTLCYLLPIVQSLIDAAKSPREMNTPRALILVPNRELAYQVGEMANILCENLGLKVKIVVGGKTKSFMMNPQFEEMDILVGTPGVIGKLSTVGIYRLNEVRQMVLDEADTLLDDSFIERMSSILKRAAESQVILVSATLPNGLPDMLHSIAQELEHVTSPKIHKPLVHIQQHFLRLSRSLKPSHLIQVAKTNKSPMLIFTNKNETCNWLAMFLRENGVDCANINGDMNYAIRIEQWNKFVRGEVNILSSTDVGSRGLDTTQVRHVLNYDFPLYAADYLHRVGRTGRIGSPALCKATNFVAGPREVSLVQQIEMAVRKNQMLTNVDGNITNIVQRSITKGNERKLRN